MQPDLVAWLVPGGRACVAVVHPLNSAGAFESHDDDSRFVISGSYLDPGRTVDLLETDNIGAERCNTTGQHNGEGNTLNGTELPTLPVPAAPDAAGIGDLVNGVVGSLPNLSNVPVQI